MIARMARFEYHPERGVLYVFDTDTSLCLLRVEGARDVPPGHQIDIHLVEAGNAHHHEHCGNRSRIKKDWGQDPGMLCAAKLAAKGKVHG